jgi:hypothetical protein
MPAVSPQQALELIRNARADPMGLWPPGLLGVIGSIDAPDAYRALAMLLRNEPANVRARAARLLGDAQNPEALEALEPDPVTKSCQEQTHAVQQKGFSQRDLVSPGLQFPRRLIIL